MITIDTSQEEIEKLAPPCDCDKCNHGCTVGSGLLAKGDKKKIAQFLGLSEDELEKKYLEAVEQLNTKLLRPKQDKKPYGKCVFFKNKCTIHKVKPLQCKVAMGCKEYGEQLTTWFLLNHVLNIDDPESIRQYHTYLKSGGKTLPGGELSKIVKNKELLDKILSYERLR